MLIKLKDGAIEDISTDRTCMGQGCPTCGFGSSYVNDVTIVMTKCKILASVDAMYGYSLSEGWLLVNIVRNLDQIQQMTEAEFANWFKEQFKTLDGEISYDVYPVNSQSS